MRYSIYITPEGSINWIEKMPKKLDYQSQGHFDSTSATKDGSHEYNDALKQAKAESIPFEDQNKVFALIPWYGEPTNDPKFAREYAKRDSIYPIELDADIQKIQNPCGCEGGICGCKHPVVARIIHKKAEESERFKKPSSDELVEFALLFQTNSGEDPINREVLIEMVGFASMVIDRLYENGDITKPSSKEK